MDNHGNTDHRELLRGQAELQGTLQRLLHSQGETLKAIEGMRADFRSMMMDYRKETKDEVKALRERLDTETGDIHARINETDRIARATATKMGGITWGLYGAWGAVLVGGVTILVKLVGAS